MLSKFDDYPIHQTPEPVAVPATTDRNAYDRYWFNGYAGDGEFYFGIGAALTRTSASWTAASRSCATASSTRSTPRGARRASRARSRSARSASRSSSR